MNRQKKIMMALLVAVVGALGLGVSSASAEGNGTLSGVVNKGGGTVSALVVVSDAQTGAFVASTFSSAASGFSLSLPAGVYSVTASDFDTSISTFVSVSSGSTTSLILTLPSPSPLPFPFPF